MTTTRSFYLGVEWAGDRLRAGVFDEHWRLVGKSFRSAKTERGFDEVLKRIAQCALDAVDEADLPPESIAAFAVLTDGHDTEKVWRPSQVNQLAGHLPPRMGSNLVTAGRITTIMWTLHEQELFGAAKSWLGLFTEPAVALFSAERAQPGVVKPITLVGQSAESVGIHALPAGWLAAAVDLVRPEFLLVVGSEFEDAQSGFVRLLGEHLSGSGVNVPVHVPSRAGHVGPWAAARLAQRTFSACLSG